MAAANAPPQAFFEWTPVAPTTVDHIRILQHSSDPDGHIIRYDWLGPFNGTSQNPAPAGRMRNPGTYEMSLTVTDNDGATDTYIANITVAPTPPIADFTWIVPSRSGVPTTNDFIRFQDASTDEDGRVITWTWLAEGGQLGFRESYNHRFTAPGTYNVSLTAGDNHGATRTIVKQIEILPGDTETLRITYQPESPTPNTPLRFRAIPDLPRGVEVVSWSWLWSDGGASRDREPIHVFKEPGTFVVGLKAKLSNGNEVQTQRNVTIDTPLQTQDIIIADNTYVAPIVMTVAVVGLLALVNFRNRNG